MQASLLHLLLLVVIADVQVAVPLHVVGSVFRHSDRKVHRKMFRPAIAMAVKDALPHFGFMIQDGFFTVLGNHFRPEVVQACSSCFLASHQAPPVRPNIQARIRSGTTMISAGGNNRQKKANRQMPKQPFMISSRLENCV